MYLSDEAGFLGFLSVVVVGVSAVVVVGVSVIVVDVSVVVVAEVVVALKLLKSAVHFVKVLIVLLDLKVQTTSSEQYFASFADCSNDK